VRIARGLVAGAAAQVMTEVLEEQRVEPEQPAHRLAAQGPVVARLDRVSPLLGHALRAPRDVAPGAVGGGQHEA
jgi:hypothetical protein